MTRSGAGHGRRSTGSDDVLRSWVSYDELGLCHSWIFNWTVWAISLLVMRDIGLCCGNLHIIYRIGSMH